MNTTRLSIPKQKEVDMSQRNYTPTAGTVRELKRQVAFNKTSYNRYEAKHQAKQAELAEKIAKLEQAIADAEELENLDAEWTNPYTSPWADLQKEEN